MRIGIDIDDVLMETTGPFVVWHNRVYGTDKRFHELREHDLSGVLDVEPAAVTKRWLEFADTSEFKRIGPYGTAQEVIRTLARDCEIVIITARPEVLEGQTRSWLDRYFSGQISDVHFADNYVHNGRKKKSEICSAEDIPVLVDDSFEHAAHVVAAGHRALVFNCPWNEDKALEDGMYRVYAWSDVGRLVQNV